MGAPVTHFNAHGPSDDSVRAGHVAPAGPLPTDKVADGRNSGQRDTERKQMNCSNLHNQTRRKAEEQTERPAARRNLSETGHPCGCGAPHGHVRHSDSIQRSDIEHNVVGHLGPFRHVLAEVREIGRRRRALVLRQQRVQVLLPGSDLGRADWQVAREAVPHHQPPHQAPISLRDLQLRLRILRRSLPSLLGSCSVRPVVVAALGTLS